MLDGQATVASAVTSSLELLFLSLQEVKLGGGFVCGKSGDRQTYRFVLRKRLDQIPEQQILSWEVFSESGL